MTDKCQIKSAPKFLQLFSHNRHTLAWCAVYFLLFLQGIRFDIYFSLISATLTTGWMLLLYSLVRKILIKKLLQNHRALFYYIISFTLICFMMRFSVTLEIIAFKFVTQFIHIEIPPRLLEAPAEQNLIFPYFRMGVLLIGTFAVSTISYLLEKSKNDQKQANALMNEKLDMELRYLKAQINPHFLFNALNNIYSLVYTNDDNAAESILKLSEMLRYVTDECQADKISISKEVKYIDNFIDFQLLRMESYPNIEFSKDIVNPEFKIPPMILQPLVENAFKHSRLENNNKGYVKIDLRQNDKQLIFTTENSQSACVFSNQKERSGIGVNNVQKRLELAYGENYSFNVDSDSHHYKVEIVINL